MKTVLIDNEQNIREGLKELLSMFCPNVEILGEAEGVESGFDLINEIKPELIFLDVEMDDGTGMDLLSKFDKIDFQVIFCTAHDKYAINGFKFSAVDFILKPVDPDDLMNAVEKAESKIKQSDNINLDTLLANLNQPEKQKKIVLKDSESIHIIKIDEIISLEAEGSYTRFRVENISDVLVSKNLKEYEEMLPEKTFFRPHGSFLVNMDKVVRFHKKDGGTLILDSNVEVPVSVRKKEELLVKLTNI